MPHFDEFYAGKLRGSHGVADAEDVLDLRGATLDEAKDRIQDILERSRFASAKAIAIRLDPPAQGGGETLFQPVGRWLLEARKRGWIEHLRTLPAPDGLGFHVELAGRPENGAA